MEDTYDPSEEFKAKINTDEDGLTKCGCGSNNLNWRPPKDNNAGESDHTLEEARSIGGTFIWDYKDPETINDSEILDMDFTEWKEVQIERAERNGLVAFCGDCYGSMNPTVATDELVDRAGRD